MTESERRSGYVREDTWRTVVETVPIVSVDLVVRQDEGVLLGKRRNPPARGEWFVPGGRVLKGESLETAVHRVAATELGRAVTIERRLGVYEHRYDDSEFDGVAKHYVPVAYEVTPDSRPDGDPRPDDQHDRLEAFAPPFAIDLHPYVETYLRDAGVLDG